MSLYGTVQYGERWEQNVTGEEKGEMTTSANILVVEDDRTLATLLNDILSIDGYRVTQAGTGNNALQRAIQAPPDLMLLDIMLPDIDGYAVLDSLRNEPKTMHVPVIMLTALRETSNKLRAFDLLANDYLTKPFEGDELLARIRIHLYHTHSSLRNPLTGLPSGRQIERAIERRSSSGDSWALLYLDLDHFKALNDSYGFLLGNEMIRLFTDAVVASVREHGMPQDFVGHVGGEDFVVLTVPSRIHPLCQAIFRRFKETVRQFYSKEDLDRGSFWAMGRDGIRRWFPLVSISIAVLLPERMRLPVTFEQISHHAALLKMRSKGVPDNCYMIDGDDRVYFGDGSYHLMSIKQEVS